jgi:hypothetical protein
LLESLWQEKIFQIFGLKIEILLILPTPGIQPDF